MTTPPVALPDFALENWAPRLGERRFLTLRWDTDPDFDRALKAIILREEPNILANAKKFTKLVGMKKVNTTTAFKSYNLFAWEYPEFRQIRRMAETAICRYLETYELPGRTFYLQCWCNIMRAGKGFALHTHYDDPDGFTGVYYPHSLGATEQHAGKTLYEVSPGSEEFLYVSPARGMMNLFQGNIPHHVVPFRGDGEPRVSIAFDVGQEQKEDHPFITFEPDA